MALSDFSVGISEGDREALAEAYLAYKNRVREILERHEEATLLAYGNEKEKRDAWRVERPWEEEWKREARMIVAIRESFRKAEPVCAAGGAYCVMHDCDVRECPEGEHE